MTGATDAKAGVRLLEDLETAVAAVSAALRVPANAAVVQAAVLAEVAPG